MWSLEERGRSRELATEEPRRGRGGVGSTDRGRKRREGVGPVL